jgi:hypothetical protein
MSKRRSRFSNPVPALKAVASVGEKAAAQQALAAHPSWTIDKVTHAGYAIAYPNAGQYPDFYDSDGTNAMRWARIRDWVDYFRNKPLGGLAAAPKAYSEPSPLRSLGVPFAAGATTPIWPVRSTDPRGCDVNYLDVDGTMHGMLFQRFGATRGAKNWASEQSRYHIGHDCIANPGDLVVAPEAGEVVAIRPFYAGTEAMYLQTTTNLTLVLGEIAPNSGAEFGVGVGTVVQAGQWVARIGTFDLALQLPFHMLHFETWAGQRDRSANWLDGDPMPHDLRNPTDYLLRATCTMEQSFAIPMPQQELVKLGVAVMSKTSPRFHH